MIKNFMKRKTNIFGIQIADYLLIILGLSVFSAITLFTITKSSIWFDEAFGAYIIRFNFFDIAKYTAFDVHPPLYYWVLKLWSMFFGNSELAIRSMSLLFGGISIVLGYLITNRLFGRKAARYSLLFLVLSPMLIRYSQEARMYTMVVAIAMMATLFLLKATESNKKTHWMVYGIFVGLGMWTHYFSAIIWIAHWVWRAYVIKCESSNKNFNQRFFSKEWKFTNLVALGLFVPWLPFFITQLSIVQAFGFWIPPVTPNTVINYLSNVIFYQESSQLTGWLALYLIILFIGFIFIGHYVYEIMNKDRKKYYILLIIISVFPIILLFIMSLPPLRSSFVDRYLFTSSLFIAIYMGVTLSYCENLFKSYYTYVIAILVAVAMVIGIGNVYQLGNFNKNTNSSNNTRQIIEKVKQNSESKLPIIAGSPWLFYESIFYSSTDNPVYFIEPSEYEYGSLEMLRQNDQFKIKDINSFVAQNPLFWYVIYSNEEKISGPCPNNCKEIKRLVIKNSFNNEINYQAIKYQTIGY